MENSGSVATKVTRTGCACKPILYGHVIEVGLPGSLVPLVSLFYEIAKNITPSYILSLLFS